MCRFAEVEELAIEEILEASGSGDDQASALANGAKLRAFGEAADDERRGL